MVDGVSVRIPNIKIESVSTSSVEMDQPDVVNVIIEGRRWLPVADLAESKEDDRHYQLKRYKDEALTIQFGDGIHGRGLPAVAQEIVATYRKGGGVSGSVYKAVLRPDEAVEISGLGEKFKGVYYVHEITHTIHNDGYPVKFKLSRPARAILRIFQRKKH
jgi:hypothetical protein